LETGVSKNRLNGDIAYGVLCFVCKKSHLFSFSINNRPKARAAEL